LNDLIINTTGYYIVTVILYVIAVIFFVLLFFAKVRKIVYTYFQKFAKSITDRKFYPALKTNIQSLFLPFLVLAGATFCRCQNISVNHGQHLKKMTGFLFYSNRIPYEAHVG